MAEKVTRTALQKPVPVGCEYQRVRLPEGIREKCDQPSTAYWSIAGRSFLVCPEHDMITMTEQEHEMAEEQ